jgi:AraC-like DNA-binding protein
MDYASRVPRPPLDALIDDLYYLEGPAPYPRMKVPPMPSEHLMVNLGEPFRMHDAMPAAPPAACVDSWCMGLWTRYYVVEWPLPVRLVGVHFKPGGLYPFLRTPLSELRDQVVPLEAIWGRLAAELRERLHAAPTAMAALALLERLLLARLADTPPGLNLVRHAIGRIAGRHGAVSIRALSDRAGISMNHLGTQFKHLVGIPPKRLARIYRFARVVTSLDAAGPVDWSYLAHQAQYYDQSHFNKEFVAFTGHSPTDYLRLRRRFLAENPDHALDLGPLPTD